MNKKSNLTVLSNIYPIKKSLYEDFEFIQRVRGRNAISKALKNSDLKENQLTAIQKKEFREDVQCSLLDKNDKAWGPILNDDGDLIWTCKCTKIDCKYIDECRPELTMKELVDIKDSIQNDKLIKNKIKDNSCTNKPIKYTYEQINIQSNNNKLKELNDIEINKEKIRDIEVSEKKNLDCTCNESETVKINEPKVLKEISNMSTIDEGYDIVDQDNIIRASINDKIIVDAPPGTGKTYTLIERIKYLFNNFNDNEDVSLEEDMIVLCFSKSAVNEIKSRLDKAINNGEVPENLRFLDIRIFDSFATWIINQIDESIDLMDKDYDERIVLAKDIIQKEDFEYTRHFIVDEIQDLVGYRAEFVKEILENLNCGFTLLGDKCQSIYNYQVEGKPLMDSDDFYHWLNNKYNDEIRRVALNKNRRQNKLLSEVSSEFRTLITSSDKSDLKSNIVEKITSIESLGESYNFTEEYLQESFGTFKNLAFLCRNNGQALKLSGILRSNGIKHSIQKPTNSKYIDKWIGQILYNYNEDIIDYNEFLDICALNKISEENAETKWNLLKQIENRNNSKLKISELISNINKENKYIDLLFKNTKDKITISTIHRSKGKEFDKVVLVYDNDYIEKNFDDLEDKNLLLDELKLYYVATTRAKTGLSTINLKSKSWSYLSKMEDDRWIEISNRRGKKKNISFISLGQAGDINEESFISTDLFKKDSEVIKNQQYILNNIAIGDEIVLSKVCKDGYIDTYNIVHADKIIGCTSKVFIKSLQNALNNVKGIYNLKEQYYPSTIEGIYVEDIGTSISKDKIFNSVLVSGFGKLCWESSY